MAKQKKDTKKKAQNKPNKKPVDEGFYDPSLDQITDFRGSKILATLDNSILLLTRQQEIYAIYESEYPFGGSKFVACKPLTRQHLGDELEELGLPKKK